MREAVTQTVRQTETSCAMTLCLLSLHSSSKCLHKALPNSLPAIIANFEAPLIAVPWAPSSCVQTHGTIPANARTNTRKPPNAWLNYLNVLPCFTRTRYSSDCNWGAGTLLLKRQMNRCDQVKHTCSFLSWNNPTIPFPSLLFSWIIHSSAALQIWKQCTINL